MTDMTYEEVLYNIEYDLNDTVEAAKEFLEDCNEMAGGDIDNYDHVIELIDHLNSFVP